MGKVFSKLKAHCIMSLKNKLESKSDHIQWEIDDDVVALLRAIKSITQNNTEVKYVHYALHLNMRKGMNINQYEDENLVPYYKRFNTIITSLEIIWGPLCPIKLMKEDSRYATADEDERDKVIKEIRNKFLACAFINGANKKKFGKVIDSLNNDHLGGNSHYPTTVEKALDLLQNYMDSNNNYQRGKAKGGKVFVQHNNRYFYKCGIKRHVSPNCPYDSEDEVVIKYRTTKGKSINGATGVQI